MNNNLACESSIILTPYRSIYHPVQSKLLGRSDQAERDPAWAGVLGKLI